MPLSSTPPPYQSGPFTSYSRRIAHDLTEVPHPAALILMAATILDLLATDIAKEKIIDATRLREFHRDLVHTAEIWDVG